MLSEKGNLRIKKSFWKLKAREQKLGAGVVGRIKDKATGISQKAEEKDKICRIGMKNKRIRGTFLITKRPKKREKKIGGSH